MGIEEIQAELATVEGDAALYDEQSFGARAAAIDDLEFRVIDRIDGLLPTSRRPEVLAQLRRRAELARLRRRAERLRGRLEAIDAALFRRLRAELRASGDTAALLRGWLAAYVGPDSGERRRQDAPGYDSLDVFVNGLLGIQLAQGEPVAGATAEPAPAESIVREPEMVGYQPAPARVILELIERAQLTAADVFYDLGSGLGRVPILVSLLSGATARGVEIEPAYYSYASACAAGLNLAGVAFINGDARAADYIQGTAFFLYTPFVGGILQEVLGRLREAARGRTITIFTYGPCTPAVARQPWLTEMGGQSDQLYRLGSFRSR